MPLPPLNRLRKGVLSFAFLLFCFVSYRLLFFETKSDSSIIEEETVNIRTEMCLLLMSGEPMNIDSVFNLKTGINRIFAYSYLSENFNTEDTVHHIWYHGAEVIKNTVCTVENSNCFSFISADSLEHGNWSLDTRQGNFLLHIKQFKIENR